MPVRSRLIATLVTLLATLAAVPAAHAAGTGVNVGAIPNDQNVSDVIASGAKYARYFVLWSDMEPSRKGSYDLNLLAAYSVHLARLQAAGVKTVLVVTGAPAWASGSSDAFVPPRNAADFGAFSGWLAAHLKGEVAGYEIWNEPDASAFWHPAPDVSRYAALLIAAHRAIKAADPAATVLTGPTTGNDYPWIASLYAAGAKGAFDAVAVHTDTACLDRGPDFFLMDHGQLSQYTFLGYRTVHKVMADHGDGDKPIWMTELGWSSTTRTCSNGHWAGQKPAGVGEPDQARYLQQALHCIGFDPYVKVALWFNLQDNGTADSELNRYGLLRSDHSRKPSWDAFHDVAVSGDQLSGECGDLSGPALTVASPTAGAAYMDRLDISATASDPKGVSRYLLIADGKKIKNFGGENPPNGVPATLTWWHAADLSPGSHTITIVAIDKGGNRSHQDVTVTHLTAAQYAGQVHSTQPVKIKVKVRGKHLVRIVSGRVVAPLPPSGVVQVLFQVHRKGRWRIAHRRSRPARKPFRVKQVLNRPGRWRVRVVYLGAPPYKVTASAYRTFAAR